MKKERMPEGLGVVKHIENLTMDDENTLWETGVINKDT
jgi:hypothetical protein